MDIQSKFFTVIREPGLGSIECMRLSRTVTNPDDCIQVRRWDKSQWVDGKSIMSLMLLALAKGMVIEIRVESDSASKIISAITALNDILQIASKDDMNDATKQLEQDKKDKQAFNNQLTIVDGYDLQSGILIEPTNLPYSFADKIRDALGTSLILTVIDSNEVYTDAQVTKIVERRAGFIILPLSLPNFCSLRLAEKVHQAKLGTRLLLVSGTNCPGYKFKNLFDGFTYPNAFDQEWFRSALQEDVVRLSDQNFIDLKIQAVLKKATCFRTYGGRHLMAFQASWEEYKGEDDPDSHVSVELYVKVRRELLLVAEKLGELSNRSDYENSLIRDILDMEATIVRQGCGPSGAPLYVTTLAKKALQLRRNGRLSINLPALSAFTKTPPVFISYSHEDSEFVDTLERSLVKAGHTVWRDVKSAVAGPLEEQVNTAVMQSIVLVVLTKASINSDWVEWEVRRARQAQKDQGRHTICPVALDNSWSSSNWPSRLRAQLEEYLILDFSAWEKNNNYNNALQRLLVGLDRWYQND